MPQSLVVHTIKFTTNRLIKILANLAKGVFFLVHWSMPDMRFTLPRSSPPLLERRDHRVLPRTIWQTNFTDKVTFPVYLNYLFNRIMAPTYEYRLATDDDCQEFVRTAFPGTVWHAYQELQIGAARADFWRVLVLLKYGGVYIDIDAHLMWPLERLIDMNDDELFVADRSGRLTNYFMASAPGNVRLAKIVQQITDNIQASASNDVFELTGPGALRSVLVNEQMPIQSFRFVCDQGNFTNSFFQYADHPAGKWSEEQQRTKPLRARSVS